MSIIPTSPSWNSTAGRRSGRAIPAVLALLCAACVGVTAYRPKVLSDLAERVPLKRESVSLAYQHVSERVFGGSTTQDDGNARDTAGSAAAPRTADQHAPQHRRDCWWLTPGGDSLSLRVYHGLTVSDLGVHFRMPFADVRKACDLRGNGLRAGQICHFALTHLRPVFHQVEFGETLGALVLRYGLPTRYTLRVYNCLPSNRIVAGERLLVLVPRVASEEK